MNYRIFLLVLNYLCIFLNGIENSFQNYTLKEIKENRNNHIYKKYENEITMLNDEDIEQIFYYSDKKIWIVHFFANWSGHCKNFKKKIFLKIYEKFKNDPILGVAVANSVQEANQDFYLNWVSTGFPYVSLFYIKSIGNFKYYYEENITIWNLELMLIIQPMN